LKFLTKHANRAFFIMVAVYVLAFGIAYVKDFKPNHSGTNEFLESSAKAFYQRSCVNGVQHLHFMNASFVQVDANGKPVPCSK